MKFLILNGPNLNFLGIREPDIYGRQTYDDLVAQVRDKARELGVEVTFYQSNHEGDLVDAIQRAYTDRTDGIVFNPAAYTHTSVAIADAVKAVGILVGVASWMLGRYWMDEGFMPWTEEIIREE